MGRPRSAVAIYRGGPLDYGVGKNYTTVFIIPGGGNEDGGDGRVREDEGRHGDQRPRVTLSCEDGLPARDRRSTPLGLGNFQGNSAGKVGHQVSRYGRFDAFESLAGVEVSALV